MASPLARRSYIADAFVVPTTSQLVTDESLDRSLHAFLLAKPCEDVPVGVDVKLEAEALRVGLVVSVACVELCG